MNFSKLKLFSLLALSYSLIACGQTQASTAPNVSPSATTQAIAQTTTAPKPTETPAVVAKSPEPQPTATASIEPAKAPDKPLTAESFTAIANAQSDAPRAFRGRCRVPVVGLEKGSRVNMRSAPRVESEIVGYVLVGQTVSQLYDGISGFSPIVRQSDREGVSWDYVEYIPSQTRGWIASHLLDQRCSGEKRPF